jgi:hypothetical protein
MPSLRSRFELGCRVGAFAALGWLIGTSVFPASGRRVERATQSDVDAKLASWTRMPSSVVLHGEFSSTPSAAAIDWLAALKRTGHVVTWSGSPPAIALSAESNGDPRGGARIDVAAPADEHVVLRDDASIIDSIHVSRFGGSVNAPILVGNVRATVAGEVAAAPAPDSSPTRSIVVLGAAGWEGKYVAAALEERGWPVITKFIVAPNVQVGPPGDLQLDTSRVAAVVAIDTVVQRSWPAVERFVRMGGGLVLAGPSSLAPAASSIAPGATGARFQPAVLPRDTILLGSTGFFPVLALKPDAVALERRTGGVAVAARRIGAGRVIQIGYDDSWRWRMAGPTGSENAHREWWSRVIAAVAYVPERAATPDIGMASSAPVALLVDRIGAPRPSPPVGARNAPIDRRLILGLIMILLLAEWGSRRLRGLK